MRLHREGTQAGWQARPGGEQENLRAAMMTSGGGGGGGGGGGDLGLRVVAPMMTTGKNAGAGLGGVSGTTSSLGGSSSVQSGQTFPFGGAAVSDDGGGGGVEGVGGGGQSFTLSKRFTGESSAAEEAMKVMISTTTADSLERILDWAQYHRLIGVDVSLTPDRLFSFPFLSSPHLPIALLYGMVFFVLPADAMIKYLHKRTSTCILDKYSVFFNHIATAAPFFFFPNHIKEKKEEKRLRNVLLYTDRD